MIRISILGIGVDRYTSDEVMNRITSHLKKGQKTTIVTVNPEIVMQARRDQHYKQILNEAELSVADGIGILLAASVYAYQPRLKAVPFKALEVAIVSLYFGAVAAMGKISTYSPIPQRTTGVDLSYRIAEYCAQNNHSLFLLGAQPGIAQLAADKLRNLYPGLIISGVYAGHGGPEGDAETLQQLEQHPSDIVLVAYGAPKQEYWASRNLHRIPQTIAMGVGGTFMFISGKTKRAPQFIQRIGFEWLFRLVTQPWRLKRQLVLPRFLFAVITDKVKQQ